ncbi:MAG TPA: hypothetical protein VM597_41405 [Gemmataceae bacterium]|nr:hypothetical protein [Gemmataceae bacterium]
MSDIRRDQSGDRVRPPGERPGCRAPEIVARLGSPVFVDMRPGCVRVTCQGVTGVGPDRASALRALADQVKAAPAS